MRRTRRTRLALLTTLMCLGLIGGPVSAAPAPPAPRTAEPSSALSGGQLQIQLVASGFAEPLGVVNAGDGSGRLFVVEKQGTVRVLLNGQHQGGYFLDLRGVAGGISTGGERGLLGLAFHPNFENNRKVFAFFTDGGGDVQVGEFTGNDDGLAVGADTYRSILTVEHSANSNHNGGQLMFGPDGALYAFIGDGGGNLTANGQNDGTFLGKMVKLVPNLSGGLQQPAAAWAKGLRNPWRASFDQANGDLWIADVGQGSWEEINKVSGVPTPAGVNYGWDCREGFHSYSGCGGSFTDPVAEYSSGGGSDCSVTGGYVYRGTVYQNYVGEYTLGDFCSGNLWTLNAASPGGGLVAHGSAGFQISSFGEAENGEIYIADYSGGNVWKVVVPTFNDVLGNPFIDDITWLHYFGVTNGCGGGSYCPSGNVTRAEMASFLARARGLPATSNDYFSDDNGNIHEGNINAVADAGITLGCGGGSYCPDNLVTREEMASFLARAMSLPASGTNWFWDDEGSIHEGNINAVADAGITLGCGGGQYCPASFTTREQMAAFLRRALT